MAPGKLLVDFGLRRAHGAEAGLLAARASYLAGFSGTPRSWRRLFSAFPCTAPWRTLSFKPMTMRPLHLSVPRSLPKNVDFAPGYFDTEAAAEKVLVAPTLARDGIKVKGVRLDSGDLADHAFKVRRILDAGGLTEITIFASGSV